MTMLPCLCPVAYNLPSGSVNSQIGPQALESPAVLGFFVSDMDSLPKFHIKYDCSEISTLPKPVALTTPIWAQPQRVPLGYSTDPAHVRLVQVLKMVTVHSFSF
ncbi:hypothetical protein H671_6g15810 [Cricetulus griseus]|nr:hypothetical protein H671_6g15810 [Cricetulus griseus]